MTVEQPLEIELKYRVASPDVGERLLNGELLGSFEADGPFKTVESEDRYVDTREGALAHAGYAARLRRERASTTLTVKSLGASEGALQRRTEIEGPAGGALAPADWPHSPARSFVLELSGDAPLTELVTVRQVRRKRRFRDGTTFVELSLDDVDVIAGAQSVARFLEVEIELLSGPEGPLLELRTALDADPGLTASGVSKLDAALAAANVELPGREVGGGREGRSRRRTGRSALPSGGGASVQGLTLAGDGPTVSGSTLPGSLTGSPAGGGGAATAHEMAESIRVMGDAKGRGAPSTNDGAGVLKDDRTVTDAASAVDLEPRRQRRAKRESKVDAARSEPTDGVSRPDTTVGGARPEPPPLIVGKTPGVTSGDVVAEAGRKVLRFHLARLIAREPGTRSGEDPKELHGMRVATRRMRAAWRVFGDGFRPDGTKRFRNRLRDVAAKLGAVRDIDVLVIALEEYRASLPADEGGALETLVDDWRAEREAGRVVLMRELDSDGYRRFVDDYRAFVLTPGAGALVVSPTDPHHVRDTAGSHIWRAYENVLAYGPVLRWADVPTLHQLRIAGKWLRYTLEFVAEALGPDAKPLIERVVAMQDHLGLMNDAEVAAMKARAHLVARSGTLTDAQTAAVARYLTSREREVARLKRGASAPWRGLASPAFRRGLGRAIATLAASPGGSATGG